jgi:hypothetical protein
MVLSKVDPFDGAFPGGTPGPAVHPSELNLTQSFTQPQIVQAKIITQHSFGGKKNPFKGNDK